MKAKYLVPAIYAVGAYLSALPIFTAGPDADGLEGVWFVLYALPTSLLVYDFLPRSDWAAWNDIISVAVPITSLSRP